MSATVQVTIDAHDPRALSVFWKEVLGYVHPAPPGTPTAPVPPRRIPPKRRAPRERTPPGAEPAPGEDPLSA